MSHTDTCPYCRFPISPSDPTIICSDCRMVHHRECWEANRGCTTYGCQGVAGTRTLGSPPDTPAADQTLVIDLPPADSRSTVEFPPDRTAHLPPVAQPSESYARGTPRLFTFYKFTRALSRWMVYAAIIWGLLWAAHQYAQYASAQRRVSIQRSATRLRVVAGRTRLHVEPSRQSPVIASLPAGAVVELLSVTPDWAQVKTTGGKTGYLPRDAIHTVEHQRRRLR